MNAEFSSSARGGLPPVPALIPINTVLHPHGGLSAHASECDDGDSESGFSVDRVVIERDSGGGRHSRTRRSTAQPVHSIDSSVRSRDRCVTSQAPTRRPERHRKSDRRRCRQRVERQKCITTSSTCSPTHNTVRRKVVNRSPDKSEPEHTTVPRVNPIFLWVKQEDTRIVEVRCEDYDKRNRIRLTKTAHGWRAIPRTETLAPASISPIPSEQQSDQPKVKQRSKSKSRKNSKSKRKLLEHQSSVENGYRESDEAEESEIRAHIEAREENELPAWSAPVNIESLLPSHTITFSRKKVLVDEPDVETVKDSECCVNSGDCNTPPRLPSPNPNITVCNDVRPLDNLLAVAEFEFNHQMQTEKERQELEEKEKENESLFTSSLELSESISPEITELVTSENILHTPTEIEIDPDKDQNYISSSPQYELSKDAFETVADLSEQHKEFFDNIVQLNKLIESRSEKTNNATIAILEQSKEAVGIGRQPEDCDYNDEDENNITMDDIITRLEQSLQSPDNCNDVDQLCAEASSFISIDLTEKDENTESVINNHFNNNELTENDNIDNLLSEQGNLKTEFDCTNELTDDIIAISKEISLEENDINSVQQPDSNFVEKSSDNLSAENDGKNDVLDNLPSDNDEPTDLSISNKRNNQPEYEEYTENVEDDLLPTDLSFPKNQNPTPPLRIETPRPPSHSSETIQSPQPSGIPAVPPSPDIFFSNSQKSKSLFLETLLSSSSPKLCLTPEVTITRQQKEPLDLGKSRKSASPTITCSEEVKVKNDTFKYDNVEGEPNAKKMKIEDITLKNLLDKSKTDVKVSRNSPIEKPETNNNNNNKLDSSKLLQLLTNDVDLDPQIQFKQLLTDQELNVPDPLLVPKEKLSQILAAPAIEIPRLLASRPELRLPDALAFPQLLQNPDILVISLAQLQLILQKQSETLKLQETLTKNIEKPAVKVTTSASQKSATKSPNCANESSSHHTQPSNNHREHSSKSSHSKPKENKGVSGLANDIDAATTAAFNQMLWLPYLNQLEATAAACGNNPEFLKALNSVFPPSMPMMDTNHFFPNFGLQNSFPPPVDYTNPLEMALWQEALMKSNMSNSLQQSYQRSKNLSDNFSMKMPYRENNNNIGMESRNLHMAKKNALQKLHSSARTSPIVHNFQQLSPQQSSRFGPMQESHMQSNMGLGANPYLNSIPSVYQFSNPNLQMPQYNTNFPHWGRSQHSPRVNHSSKSSGVSNYPSYNNNTNSKHDYIKYQQSLINAYSQRKHSQEKQSMKHSKHVENNMHLATSAPHQQKPRVTCKSLQNLLSPSRLTQDLSLKKLTHDSLKHLPSSTSITPLSTQPIDLSNMRYDMNSLGSKLKVKHHLLDNMRPPKLFKHDEIPEVGSTTASIEEMTTAQLHDAQTQLWHPLFGNAPLQHAM